MTLHTLAKWNELGYRIRKGSKKIRNSRTFGLAMFSEDQVYKPERRFLGYPRGYDPYEEDDDYDEGLSGYDYGGDY